MELKRDFSIREIEPSDNHHILKIIKDVSIEFNSDPKTTILGDPCINHMYENYRDSRAIYYIVESAGKVIGGCGINKLTGSNENICELQRMFIIPEARGLGLGKALLNHCINSAKQFNYSSLYLESLSPMLSAIKLYENFGFKKLAAPLGSTGHTGCDVYMVLDLVKQKDLDRMGNEE
jgi:putative acetyltransferase